MFKINVEAARNHVKERIRFHRESAFEKNDREMAVAIATEDKALLDALKQRRIFLKDATACCDTATEDELVVILNKCYSGELLK